MSFFGSLKKISIKKIVTGVEHAASGALKLATTVLAGTAAGAAAAAPPAPATAPATDPNPQSGTILLMIGAGVLLFLLFKRG